MRKLREGLAIALMAGLWGMAAQASAASYIVNSTTDAVDQTPGDGTCATAANECTLRAAVQEANAHPGADVITLPAGTFPLALFGSGEDASATGDLDVTESLEIDGAGADATIIDGYHQDRVLHVLNAGTYTLKNLSIRNGMSMSDPGGGVFVVTGSLALDTVHVTGNYTTGAGGGVVVATGTLSVTNSAFENDFAATGGALFFAGPGDATVGSTTFTRNSATGVGGGAYFANTGTTTVQGVTVDGNTAATGGGMVAIGTTFDLSASTLDGNYAAGPGGGLIYSGGGNVTLTNVTVTNNLCVGPAAGSYLSAPTGTVTIAGSDFSDNAGQAGTGLYVVGSAVSIADTTLRRNAAVAGPAGGAYVLSTTGSIALSNVEASENSAQIAGGFYLISNTSMSLTKVRALNNGVGGAPAGGIYAIANTSLTMSDSSVDGNVATLGAGAYLVATTSMAVDGSTFSNNRALGTGAVGGGLYAASGAASTLTNATISGNSAEAQAGGAVIAGPFTVRNVTFAGNAAPLGSAILNGGTTTITSSIIAGASGNHCAGGPLTSGGSNIDSDGSCALAGTGDQNVDPQLGPLQDNGGPTLTHLPAAASPAIDHGNDTGCPSTDQRGQGRPADGDGNGTAVCDVGAVEFLDLCPDDPAKTTPGVCGCGVPDTDAALANGVADCLVNGELKARIARAKTIIGALSGDSDPVESELSTIGASLPAYVKQHKNDLVLNAPKRKVAKLAKKASKAVKKVTKAKAGPKLDGAKSKANTALDGLDGAVAPQP